jgi:pimeloyl-ACP methyl ester carboxylesterase
VYIQSTNTPRARFFGPKLDPNGKLLEFLPHVRPQKRVTGISGLEDQIARPMMHSQESGLKAMHPTGVFHTIPDAGHWVQQEQPQAVLEVLLPFVDGLSRA